MMRFLSAWISSLGSHQAKDSPVTSQLFLACKLGSTFISLSSCIQIWIVSVLHQNEVLGNPSLINSSTGMDQEIHSSGQGRIDSVKINPSLLSMKEWFVQPWGFKFHFSQIRIFPQIGIFLSLKLAIFSNLYFLLQICIFLSFHQFTCHSSLLLPTLHL